MIHNFTIVISTPSIEDNDVANRLYENNCGDALFCFSNGRYEICFSREAVSIDEAIKSAIEDVKKADIGVEIYLVDKHFS
jgi:hypothetical protein